ncbi:MAG: hypothetical protein Q9187_001755 [Circinaria calcarea]
MPSIKPVTALAFVKCGQSLLLLAGEGSSLRVFDHKTSELLQSLEVLLTENIHGIEGCDDDSRFGDDITSGRSSCLVWGSRSVRMVQLESQPDRHGKYLVQCKLITERLQLVDWILNVCYWPTISKSAGRTSLEFAVLTAHNVLFLLSSPIPSTFNEHTSFTAVPLSAGPLSVLYSGHLICVDSDRLLVASGTVFGEILVWTCTGDFGLSSQSGMGTGHLLHCFTGHEGSIFGVRISNVLNGDGVDHPLRVVVSCSDDRTIRVWDISDIETKLNRLENRQTLSAIVETGSGVHELDDGTHENHCLTTAMGHLSRIWGLRFLPGFGQSRKLLSYGEDATSHIWQLGFRKSLDPASNISPSSLCLETTHCHHGGKNIWAVATHEEANNSAIATGGADGRIVSYSARLGKPEKVQVRLPSHGKMFIHTKAEGVQDIEAEETSNLEQSKTLTWAVFHSLEGNWQLNRILKSAIPTYPSGTFQGTATLTVRSPTDNTYDGEYLYMEEGTLVTEQGFTLQGSRRYIYRYQQSTDTITAWFAKPDTEAADYLFHKVEFQSNDRDLFWQKLDEQSNELRATGHHLCVEDHYDATYMFNYKSRVLDKWSVGYDVAGPKKDYTANAEYTRILLEHNTTRTAEGNAEIIKIPTLSGNADPAESGTHDAHDLLKSYSWINEYELLATTVKGCVLLGQLQKQPTSSHDPLQDSQTETVSWTEIAQLPDLNSYSLVTSIPDLEAGLLSGTAGIVYFYLNTRKTVEFMVKLPRKVSSLFSQGLYGPSAHSILSGASKSAGIVAGCLGSLVAYAFTIHTNDLSKEHTASQLTQLQLPPHFIVTSAHWIDPGNLLVLGSRNGAVCFYDLSTTPIEDDTVIASACYSHIHGDDAVTVIQTTPTQELTSNLSILTAGRNGRFAVHRVRLGRDHAATNIKLETLHISDLPFGPNIEGAMFDASTDDVILWGFRSKHFVVWNDTQQKETMKVECGGSHRSWAYQHGNHGNNGGKLIWTKASTCHIHTQAEASHHLIQPGSHGREIKAMAVFSSERISEARTSVLIATGAEDTTIRIFKCNTNESELSYGFECEAVMRDHTTGIQQLRWCPDGRFLFSAAGCEELYAWRVRSVPCVGVGVVCHARCPQVAANSDLRVMDFDISVRNHEISNGPVLLSVVYSDSSVRTKFELLLASTYNTSCLTQVRHLRFDVQSFLLTAGTDGHVTFWPLSKFEGKQDAQGNGQGNKLNSEHLSPQMEISWQKRHFIHQSSVKCMSVVYLSDEDAIIATGGDDNSVALTRLTKPITGLGTPICSTLLMRKAHASAVTAIQLIAHLETDSLANQHRYRLLTSSNDQSLKSWTFSVDTSKGGVKGFSVAKEADLHTGIADVSCMEVVDSNTGKTSVVIGGIGLETLSIGG